MQFLRNWWYTRLRRDFHKSSNPYYKLKEISFYSLFDDNYSKLEVITVFLAVLELLKFKYAEVVQDENANDMIIRAKEIPDEEMNEAVSFDDV